MAPLRTVVRRDFHLGVRIIQPIFDWLHCGEHNLFTFRIYAPVIQRFPAGSLRLVNVAVVITAGVLSSSRCRLAPLRRRAAARAWRPEACHPAGSWLAPLRYELVDQRRQLVNAHPADPRLASLRRRLVQDDGHAGVKSSGCSQPAPLRHQPVGGDVHLQHESSG
jgi:hypothetical protein